jgi:hypothetical protein
VQRLATIAHGDGICTTHVTGRGKPTAPEAVVPGVTPEAVSLSSVPLSAAPSPEGSLHDDDRERPARRAGHV